MSRARDALALLLVWVALALPNHPGAFTWGALTLVPLDLAAAALLLLAAPRAWRIVAALLWAATVMKLVDLAGYMALGRALNPATDLVLVPLGWALLRDVLGLPAALGAALALVLAAWLLWRALAWAAARLAARAPGPRARPALAFGVLAAAGLAVAETAGRLDPPGEAFTTRLAWEHVRDAVAARRALAAFRAEAAAEAARPPETVLPALAGRDVLIVFVESYGRSALEAPAYAPRLRALLAGLEPRLAAAGLAVRSGWLASPVAGGQSWLARASALSGLPISDEARYRALLASSRRTLPQLAQGAGWRSVALVPAITRPWPEAAWMGYDRVLAAQDLGYAGPSFGWAPAPDQFALAALERAELGPGPRAPVIAEIALVSSHAPWTPLPTLRPWPALGDGSDYRAEGPSAEALWRDPEAVRAHYAAAVAYSLGAAVEFALRHPEALTLILGDHPPAPFVALAPGRDVPAHLIGPPALVDRAAAWGWTPGLRPGPEVASRPMSGLRDALLAAFAAPETQTESAAARP